MPSSDRTMRSTCSFGAAPQPVTVSLTSLGEYSATSQPALAASASTMPLAWPTDIAVRTLVWNSTRSMATTVGRCSAIRLRISRWRWPSRSATGRWRSVTITPAAMATGRRPRRSMTP